MEDLEVIVQRMIDAGEPEESIAAVIQEYQDQNNKDQSKSDVIEPRQDETIIEPTPVSKISSADIEATIPQTDTVATTCLLYTSPSPRDATLSRMPSSA